MRRTLRGTLPRTANRSPYIEHIIRRIALIKDMEYEAAEEILYENGCRFFHIPRDEKE